MLGPVFVLCALSSLRSCYALKIEKTQDAHLSPTSDLGVDEVTSVPQPDNLKTLVRSNENSDFKERTFKSIQRVRACLLSILEAIPSVSVLRHALVWGSVPVVSVAFVMVYAGSRVTGIWTVMGMVGCIVGLFVTWMGHGFLTEIIMTRPYSNSNGSELFPSVVFLVLANRIATMLCSGISVTLVQRKPLVTDEMGKFVGGGITKVIMAAMPAAFLGVVASWLQFGSLSFVTFTTQTLFKSAKLLPMMLMGGLVLRKTYAMADCIEAVIISAGIATFTWYGESPEPGKNFTLGLAMLLSCMFCDIAIPYLQRRSFINSGLDASQIMFHISAASAFFAWVILMCSGQVNVTVSFIMAHPDALVDVIAMSGLAVAGQTFIYLMTKEHGPGVVGSVMTGRQAASSFLSCVAFGHNTPPQAIIGVGVAFTFLILRALREQRTPEPVAHPQPVPQKKATSSSSQASTTASVPCDDNASDTDSVSSSVPQTQIKDLASKLQLA